VNRKATKPRTTDKNYARQHGRFRGGTNCDDEIAALDTEPVPGTDEAEGINHFVQATTCRRKVCLGVFESPATCMFFSFSQDSYNV
jgi:hypothetical protein